MGDHSIDKVSISGPVLASMIQRFSTSLASSIDGLIFGHITLIPPSLTDDDSSSSSPILSATITSFFCSNSTHSFYNSSGHVDPLLLRRLIHSQSPSSSHLLGWISGRRKSHLRPSLREFSVSNSLSSIPSLQFPAQNPPEGPTAINPNLIPSLFLLFASPIAADQPIHTHEYRAYQFRTSKLSLEPKSIQIVNIGPAFRANYDNFTPNSPFPILPFDLRASPMNVDRGDDSLDQRKQLNKDQTELDMCTEGYDVGSLGRLMGTEAANYTNGVEDLYEKMLMKIASLTKLAEKSSAKVHEQEVYNKKLRYKFARLAAGLE